MNYTRHYHFPISLKDLEVIFKAIQNSTQHYKIDTYMYHNVQDSTARLVWISYDWDENTWQMSSL